MAKESKPSTDNPGGQHTTASTESGARPTLIPNQQQSNIQNATVAEPTLEPPSGGIAARGGAGGATAWGTQTVGGLWSIAEDKNSWVFVNNVGWIKLSNASESGIMALTMLCASARQTGTQFNYRQEADNMIHEIYVW
jgi:hypothetical protein